MLDTRPSPSPYPAADPGFAAVPVDELLAGQTELIARIRLCYGADAASFEAELFTPMRRYAAYVHLLPATPDNYFASPGGLLRLGLETAFYSLQGTDAHIFSGRLSISARRQLEPRWRLATFLAGLCCEAHRPLSQMIVTDPAGELWPAYLTPLADWLAGPARPRYFLRWRPPAAEARALGLFALPRIVPAALLQHLAEGNAVIVPQLLASVGGLAPSRERNVLDELVRRALALVVDRHLAASPDRYGAPQYGSHLERYLVDALRRLVARHTAWTPNREKSRLWYGQDGLFLVWPGAADDLQALLDAEQMPGIPRAPQTVLELLLAAGVLEAGGERATWTIRPPGTKAPLEAVKLASPALLLAGLEPAPAALSQRLAFTPEAAPPAPPGTQFSLIPPPEPTGAEAPLPPTAPPPACARPIALTAPLRLNPAVRDALAQAIASLNPGHGPAAVGKHADGVFVPLAVFERAAIPPALALRALAEAGLLVPAAAGGPPTVTRDFNGAPTLGLVLAPQAVAGLDPAAVVAPAGGA